MGICPVAFGKVTGSLPLGFEKIDDFSKTLLDYIKEHGGRINLNDKSPAEDIYNTFGVSKKTFKKGVGTDGRSQIETLPDIIILNTQIFISHSVFPVNL